MLCIGLTLSFAGVGMASAVDRIQHQAHAADDHSHIAFSKITIETSDHQHDPHPKILDDQDKAPDHQPGKGHHHHGDSGSSLLAHLPQGSSSIFAQSASWCPTTDDGMLGLLIHGPERPPKGIALQI